MKLIFFIEICLKNRTLKYVFIEIAFDKNALY